MKLLSEGKHLCFLLPFYPLSMIGDGSNEEKGIKKERMVANAFGKCWGVGIMHEYQISMIGR